MGCYVSYPLGRVGDVKEGDGVVSRQNGRLVEKSELHRKNSLDVKKQSMSVEVGYAYHYRCAIHRLLCTDNNI